jgi:hypothetical protein
VTSIYTILRPVYLFSTLYLFGSSWSSGVWLDRDKVYRIQPECVSSSLTLLTTLRSARPICASHHACVRRLKHEASLFRRHAVAAGGLVCVRHSLIAAAIEHLCATSRCASEEAPAGTR